MILLGDQWTVRCVKDCVFCFRTSDILELHGNDNQAEPTYYFGGVCAQGVSKHCYIVSSLRFPHCLRHNTVLT